MALDTNIALGVKPIEQPNMLAQMGQMMQIRQAQQGFESENALRDFYAQGGDLSTAEGKRQLMSKVGLKGMDIIGKQSEISSRDIGTAEKSLAMMKNQAGLVRTPQDAANWLTSFYKNPLTRSYVESIAPLDQALAAIPNDPAGLETWLKRASLKADQIFTSADAELAAKTSRYSTDVAAGTAANRLNFDKTKDAREQAELARVLGIVSPGTVSSATALPINMGGGSGSGGVPVTPPVGSVQTPPASVVPVTPPVGAAPVTPLVGAVGQPNVLATQVAPPPTSVPNVNALTVGSQKEQLIDQISQLARLPYTAASRALEQKVKEFNVLYPAEKIDQDRQGNLITIVNGVAKPVVNANGLPVQGKPLPETAFESTVGRKTGEEVVAFVNRAQAAPKNIAKIDEVLGILKSGGAVTGFGAESRLNLERAMSLFGNDVKAGKRVVDTQILDALLGSDVFPSLQSMGLGSKNIDTPAEREFIRQVITGTIQLDNDALVRLTQIRRNVETNAIKEYNQKLGSGKFDKYSKAADQKLEKIEVPNPIIRKGTHKNGRPVIEYADGTVEYGN
jgi:hypothetical protein